MTWNVTNAFVHTTLLSVYNVDVVVLISLQARTWLKANLSIQVYAKTISLRLLSKRLEENKSIHSLSFLITGTLILPNLVLTSVLILAFKFMNRWFSDVIVEQRTNALKLCHPLIIGRLSLVLFCELLRKGWILDSSKVAFFSWTFSLYLRLRCYQIFPFLNIKSVKTLTLFTLGSCYSCRKLPTHILKYHVNHCFLVQKYCESCLKKEGLMV